MSEEIHDSVHFHRPERCPRHNLQFDKGCWQCCWAMGKNSDTRVFPGSTAEQTQTLLKLVHRCTHCQATQRAESDSCWQCGLHPDKHREFHELLVEGDSSRAHALGVKL